MGVNMGLLPTKGLTLPLMSLRRHRRCVVELASRSRSCCASTGKTASSCAGKPVTRPVPHAVAARRGAPRGQDHHDHGGRHRAAHLPRARGRRELRGPRAGTVVWLGTPAGMEARLVPRRGYPIMAWHSRAALRGKGAARLGCCCRSPAARRSGRAHARDLPGAARRRARHGRLRRLPRRHDGRRCWRGRSRCTSRTRSPGSPTACSPAGRPRRLGMEAPSSGGSPRWATRCRSPAGSMARQPGARGHRALAPPAQRFAGAAGRSACSWSAAASARRR